MRESHIFFEVHIPHARMTMHTQSNVREQNLPFFPPRRSRRMSYLPLRSVQEMVVILTCQMHFLKTKPLEWQAEQIIYTDGSVQDMPQACALRILAIVFLMLLERCSMELCHDLPSQSSINKLRSVLHFRMGSHSSHALLVEQSGLCGLAGMLRLGMSANAPSAPPGLSGMSGIAFLISLGGLRPE